MAEVRGKNNHLINDDEFYKNIKASSIEKGTMAQTHAEKMREKYGDELNKEFNPVADIDKKIKSLKDENKKLEAVNQKMFETGNIDVNKQSANEEKIAKNQEEIDKLTKQKENLKPMTFAEVASNIAQSQVDSQLGQAIGISKNLDKNNAMYIENAQYGEMSKQQTTQAKIDTFGGVDDATNFDVTSAKLKATEDKASLSAKLEEALKANGVDKERAKELAQAIVEGSKQGAEEFKKALDKIGEKAETLTGAKERSDYSSIDAASGDEAYKTLQAAFARGNIASQKEQIKVAEKVAAEMVNKGNMSWADENGKPLKGGKALARLMQAQKDYVGNLVSDDGSVNYDFRVGQDGNVETAAFNNGTNANPMSTILGAIENNFGDKALTYALATSAGVGLLGAINKISQKGMVLDAKKLEQKGLKLDEKTGFWKDANGKIVAKDLGNGTAALTDETGAVIRKGWIERQIHKGWEEFKNIGDNLSLFKQRTEETLQKPNNTSTNHQNGKQGNSSNDSIENKTPSPDSNTNYNDNSSKNNAIHNSSPSSNSTSSINDEEKKSIPLQRKTAYLIKFQKVLLP